MSHDITPGQAPNQCNVIIREAYETFEYQLPIEEFIAQLSDGGMVDEACVLGLDEAFAEEKALELGRVLDERANELAVEKPTLQFAVEGSFQRVPNGFELQYEEELYRLDRVFGARLRKEDDAWLVMPY